MLQFRQEAPPIPHAVVEVPATHVLPLQQPFGQVLALHGDWQVCPTHVLPCDEQFWHACPPAPHTPLLVPERQVVPLQQPFGQFCGLHCGGGLTQMPPLQTCALPLQFSQLLPKKPHAVFCVPVWQMSPMQQPPQLPGPHGGGPSQIPPTGPIGPQVVPDKHCSHARPLTPHALLSWPTRQMPLESQQPRQLVESHVVVGFSHLCVAGLHTKPV